MASAAHTASYAIIGVLEHGRERAMATRVRPKAKKLYEQDFYVWTEVQAGLLRERRFEALDLANLIEEVEGLGDAKKSAVLNNASVIIEHLLKLQHSPASDPRAGWGRFGPGAPQPARVRPHAAPSPDPPEDELARVYESARRTTERKLRLHGEETAAAALPAACPYSLDQVTGDWWP